MSNENFGVVLLTLNVVMDRQDISIYKMSKLSSIKYDVVANYYYNRIHIYNADILAKFCSILNCPLSSIITYKSSL